MKKGDKVRVQVDAYEYIKESKRELAPGRRPPKPGEVCTLLELSCSCGICFGKHPRVIMDDGCTWMTPKDSITVIEETSTETEE